MKYRKSETNKGNIHMENKNQIKSHFYDMNIVRSHSWSEIFMLKQHGAVTVFSAHFINCRGYL